MANSKPIVPENLKDVPEIIQHYVECGTEDCNKNCQFYCNPCHRPMCDQCRDNHLNNHGTKTHEVVLYRQRKRQLPVEKCKDHPTKDIDMLCEECKVSLCSKCATTNHRGHMLTDLEEIYSTRFTLCMEEIYNIHRYFLPTTQEIQKGIEQDATEVKTILEGIRTSMKAEADKLKNLVDMAVSKNMEEVDRIENSLLEMLRVQDETYKGYISYLNDLVSEFHGYLSDKSLKLIFITEKMLEKQPIPETTKPVLPLLTTGQHNIDDVAKLLGRVEIPATNPQTRTIKPIETDSMQMNRTEKPTNKDREKSDVKQTLSLSSSVTKVREYRVPGVDRVCHVSLSKSGRFWVSDWSGNFVQTDLQGNLLQKIKTTGENKGYHTVTQDGDLFYADMKVINRISMDDKVTGFIKTRDWEPVSIHSSHINGDLLVGMIKDTEAKVTRYDRAGKEIQNIQRDSKGDELYRYPHYITENINGDICTSDNNKRAVVVVNISGQHKFSYTGQETSISPYGLCTDVLGHILVCEFFSDTIHLLNKDGEFLCFIITKQQGADYPRSVCVDAENNLYVGQRNNTLAVYKYLQ